MPNQNAVVAIGVAALAVLALDALARLRRRHQRRGGKCHNFRSKSRCSDAAVSSRVREEVGEEEWEARVKLAAAYRMAAKFGWDEIVFNHITLRVPGHHGHFLINPFGLRFDEVTASSLLKVDVNGNVLHKGSSPHGFNLAGFIIHSAIHNAREDVGCVFHTHHPAVHAVASMKCGFLPLSLEASTVIGAVCPKYHDFQGITTDEAEKTAILESLGRDKSISFLRNHGVLVCGTTIEDAFRRMHSLYIACVLQCQAMQAVGGDVSKLVLIRDEVIDRSMARRGAMEVNLDVEQMIFAAMTRLIEDEDPSFRD